MDKVKNAKVKLEELFNVQAKVVGDAIRVNVKKIDPHHFDELGKYFTEVSIKRSGAGLVIIAQSK